MAENNLETMNAKRVPYERGISLEQARADSRAALESLANRTATHVFQPQETLHHIYLPGSDRYPPKNDGDVEAKLLGELGMPLQDALRASCMHYPLIVDSKNADLTNYGFPHPNYGPYFGSQGIGFISNLPDDIDFAEDPLGKFVTEPGSLTYKSPCQDPVLDDLDFISLVLGKGSALGDKVGGRNGVDSRVKLENRGQIRGQSLNAITDSNLVTIHGHQQLNHEDNMIRYTVPRSETPSNDKFAQPIKNEGHARRFGLAGTHPVNYHPSFSSTHPTNYHHTQINHTDAPEQDLDVDTLCHSGTPIFNEGGQGYLSDSYLEIYSSNEVSADYSNNDGHNGIRGNSSLVPIPARFSPFVSPPYQKLAHTSGALGYLHGRNTTISGLVPGYAAANLREGFDTVSPDDMDRSVLPHQSECENTFLKKKRKRDRNQDIHSKVEVPRLASQEVAAKQEEHRHRFTMFHKDNTRKAIAQRRAKIREDSDDSKDPDYHGDSSSPLDVREYRAYMNGDLRLNGVFAEPTLMPDSCSRCAQMGLTCKVLSRAGDKGGVFTKMRPRWKGQEVANYIVCTNCWRVNSGAICSFWHRPADKQGPQKRTVRFRP